MPEDKHQSFPKDFLWGASTSAHQVEGGNHNQWTVWELATAKEKAAAANEASNLPWTPKFSELPIWPDVKAEAEDPDNYVSGSADRHYEQFEADFDMAQSLNINALRFGIEWARLEPQKGQWDEKVVKHYHDYIQAMIDRGIEPVLNVWHWTNPVWFEELGGFSRKANLKHFDDFIEKVSHEYGKKLKYIITINEPNTYVGTGYLVGVWPPQQKNIWLAVKTYFHLVQVHKRAYRILKRDHAGMQIGIAQATLLGRPLRPGNIVDRFAAWGFNYIGQHFVFRRLRNYQDFIGMNFYLTVTFKNFKVEDPDIQRSDIGWIMEPKAIHQQIMLLWHKYRKPIIVTENGVADRKDQYRQWWIKETMAGMELAIRDGADLRGYFHWSLLDNFEWATGFWPRFGLIEVDRKSSLKRTVRPSAKWYGDQIKKLS